MSSAPSRSLPTAEPAFDLRYSIHDFEVEPHRDSDFLFALIEESMLREGAGKGLRTLDVACGVGKLAVEATRRGGEGWGTDASDQMLGLGRWLYPAADSILVRSVAEALPFRDGSFDRVICQGSLDHFVSPADFMREAARLLRPDGRVVIALANYESLSCRLGRVAHRAGSATGLRRSAHRQYWEPPDDHFHKGDLPFVRRLGGDSLRLERCYGLSMLWLLYSWGSVLDRLPASIAKGILTGLQRIAHSNPGLSDMIISVWRPNAS